MADLFSDAPASTRPSGKTPSGGAYLLDSYGLIFRAYFAVISHPLINQKDENISSIVIFFRNLKALIEHYKPAYLVAAFDSRTPTFRHEMYPAYKATRDKAPEDLHAQVPWIEDILRAMHVPLIRKDGFEADDIIATMAGRCARQGIPCYVLSSDKDLLQLVNGSCWQMQPDKANGGWEVNGVEDVARKWGIGPDKILDYLSLMGDAADNVPGVRGVGGKTALKLLHEYGSLDAIYEHAEEIKGALGAKIREDRENAYFSKKLISLRTDVPIELSIEDCRTDGLDFAAAAKLLAEHGATAVAKQYLAFAGIKPEKVILDADEPPAPAEKKKGGPKSRSKAAGTDAAIEGNTENALPLRKNKGNYRPCTALEELAAFVDGVLGSPEKAAAFDTETDGLDSLSAHLVGFSLCHAAGEAIYVPVTLPGGMFAPATISKEECLVQLGRILGDSGATLIMHNGKFDLEVLHANGYAAPIRCKLVDTMVAAWLLEPEGQGKAPYGLEYLSETKLGLAGIEFKDIVQKGQTFADVPLEQAFPYGAEDADFTWQLWQLFKPQLAEHQLDALFSDMEMKVLPILTRMEIQGIHLHKQALAEYSVELAGEIESKEQEIYREAGHEFNIASTKQLQAVLFEEQGLQPSKKTKGGGYSTDTAVLEELVERTTNPIPKAILDYRAATKLQSTYVETLPTLADANGRIHTSFIQTGTATGRLSSRDPNLQNIPVRDEAGRRIRAAFTAEPGTVLISADYAQIELVVLAHLSGDKNLCQAFTDGIDVHKSTAALIYGIKPEDVTHDMRRFAKTINFGVMYGMSAFRLSNQLGIGRTEAKNFIDQYFTTYADVKRFINDTITSAQATGYVQTIMGRKRLIYGINSRNKVEQQAAQRIAINTPIQGSAADIVKKAMIDVQEALDADAALGSRVRMLLQVHDELIFECPDDSGVLDQAVSLIRSKMEGVLPLRVPLRVSIEHGTNWGQFH